MDNRLKYPHLFEPITLGTTVFRNRLFASPISGRSLDPANRPDPECCAFYGRKAEGGAASVCIGDCVVDSENGLFGDFMIRLDDPLSGHALGRLSHAITRAGAVASVELQHGGLYSRASRRNGFDVYGPVAGIDAEGQEYAEMPESVIEATIEKYARAALNAKLCGFGMVTVHAGHGWLLSQFVSSKVNTRRDRWGGSLENRTRLPVAICEAIKRACGRGFPVEVRVSGTEVTPRGYDLDEGVAICKSLADSGFVDLIHVSAGHHEYPEVFCVTHPSIFAADSCNAVYAEAVKKQIGGKAKIATVGAHSAPEILEELVAGGKADVIQMARALLADPDLPNKVRAGRDEEIRPCLRCLSCFSGLLTGGQIYCAVNPEIGHELEYAYSDKKAAKSKNVLIAGGGIGGMQAALTAAERGHAVTLCEKSGELGGAIRVEKNVPFKGKIEKYIAYQTRQLAKHPNLEVQLNTGVTKESIAALPEDKKPDAVLAAFGAAAAAPPIEGLDGAKTASEIYTNPDLAQGRVVILGGGLVGAELGIYLAGAGRTVTIVEALPALNSGGNILHQFAIDGEVSRLGIDVRTDTRAVCVGASSVTVSRGGRTEEIAADTVINALGQTPKTAECYDLRESAPEFYVIGDAVRPSNITNATATAYGAARLI
ncbi:MAG: FAD-dependent oxidoreductase [Oscillospiraceae bacterium]|nr:FAD-dependent oxidoreductase [Oscillospiraceae bacterium]